MASATKFTLAPKIQQTVIQLLANLPPVLIKDQTEKIIPFTISEAQQLEQIESSTGQLLFDLNNKDELYQLITLAVELRKLNNFDLILAYFQKGWVARDLPFLSPFMREIRLRETLAEADILQKPLVEEGIYTCVRANCRSKRILRKLAQTRSADEPFTTFLTCVECGQRWRKG